MANENGALVFKLQADIKQEALSGHVFFEAQVSLCFVRQFCY
jgi:hypothetical protein